MIRAGLLVLVLLLATRQGAGAAPPLAAAFSEQAAADVFATALDFIAPRILVPVSCQQLTLWGLRALTAFDPALVPQLDGGRLRLFSAGRMLFDAAAPDEDDADGWGEMAAQMAAAAWAASPALKRAGEQKIITDFFDELFDRLDPYSRYVPPGEAEIERTQQAGKAGIGLTVRPRRGYLQIEAVVPDGPAAAAGLRRGDRIVAIDGKRMNRRDTAAGVAELAGENGTPVLLTIRPRRGPARDVTIDRVLLPPETVFAEKRAGLLVLRLTGFNDRTGKRLELALVKGLAGHKRPHGVVFDLRGNRGGSLRQAVDVVGAVLGNGLVATTVGRDPAANRSLQAEGVDLSGGLPVIVMVDGHSASAAEIVAAALADDRRAVVVGSATQGKGLVQTVTELPDGGELFVTWSRVLAPLGWPIQGLGVLPQVCTSLGRDVLDEQLGQLSKGQEPMEKAMALNRTARPSLSLSDILAVRNACPAAEGTDADLRAARYLIRHPAAYVAALIPPQLLPAGPVARSP